MSAINGSQVSDRTPDTGSILIRFFHRNSLNVFPVRLEFHKILLNSALDELAIDSICREVVAIDESRNGLPFGGVHRIEQNRLLMSAKEERT